MAEELQENDGGSPDDIIKNLMSGNTTSFMSMVNNIGKKIQNKMETGEISHEQLVNEAKSMSNVLTSNPEMANISKMMSGMGGMGGMGDMSAMLNMLGGLQNSGNSTNSQSSQRIRTKDKRKKKKKNIKNNMD